MGAAEAWYSSKARLILRNISRERVSTAHHGREGNFIVHPIIAVNGDIATGNWISYFMHIHARTGEPLQWMQGIYDCTYKKENGKWKFSILKWRSRLKYIESSSPVRPDTIRSLTVIAGHTA